MIHTYLKRQAPLRESKLELIVAIWKDQIQELGITTLDEFFESLLTKPGYPTTIESPSIIRSTACALMKAHPEIRPSKEQQEYNEKLNQQAKREWGQK